MSDTEFVTPQIDPASSAPSRVPHLVLDTAITRVTLLEDRAQVSREGKVRLEAGSRRLKVAGIAPVIADRSLVARGPEGVRVDEARVVRVWRIGVGEKPADAAPLHAELQRLDAEILHKSELEQLLEQRRNVVAQATQLLIDGINREMPWAKAFASQWALDVEAFFDALRALDPAILDAQHELRDLSSRMDALNLRLSEFGRVDHSLACDVEIEVTVEKAGEHVITVDYMVPCALWRPIHRATLGEKTVKVECEAAVWQATGEDWSEVQLSFSTARSTQRSEPPVMSEDRLHIQKRVDRKVDVAIREQTIATTGESQEPEETPELPGVDDGGETRLLGAARRATILSNGRMVRVPIFTFDAPAEIDRISRPERGATVHLRSRQENASKFPILAGPVDLLRGSGYVGRGQVLFIAPGEKFAFGWGAEDALRVKRETYDRRDTTRLTGKQIITRTVTDYLSNLGEVLASFTLEERVPVSEIEQVSIEIDAKETRPPATPNDQGIVTWKIDLAAHGTQEVKLVYRITASADVKGL